MVSWTSLFKQTGLVWQHRLEAFSGGVLSHWAPKVGYNCLRRWQIPIGFGHIGLLSCSFELRLCHQHVVLQHLELEVMWPYVANISPLRRLSRKLLSWVVVTASRKWWDEVQRCLDAAVKGSCQFRNVSYFCLEHIFLTNNASTAIGHVFWGVFRMSLEMCSDSCLISETTCVLNCVLTRCLISHVWPKNCCVFWHCLPQGLTPPPPPPPPPPPICSHPGSNILSGDRNTHQEAVHHSLGSFLAMVTWKEYC